MNQNIIRRNALLAQRVIQGLASRNMTGYYAEDREAALKLALSLINDNPGERVNSIIWLSVGVALVVIKLTVIDKAIDPIVTSINHYGHGW